MLLMIMFFISACGESKKRADRAKTEDKENQMIPLKRLKTPAGEDVDKANIKIGVAMPTKTYNVGIKTLLT